MKFPEILIMGNGTWHNSRKLKKTPTRFVLTYELDYHKKAYGEMIINNVSYPVEKDMITFNRPGDIKSSKFTIDNTAETEFFYFIVSSDEKSTSFDRILENIPQHICADEKIKALWSKLLEFVSDKNEIISEMQAYLQLLSLLIYLSQKGQNTPYPHASPSQNQRALFEATRYMREHLTENLSVNDIAAHIGYSQSHFNHLFKTYTHHTPHSYYISLKILEAKYMLLNTNKTVAQISEELSFGKTSQFSNAFKKECLMTPGEFRKARDAIFYNE